MQAIDSAAARAALGSYDVMAPPVTETMRARGERGMLLGSTSNWLVQHAERPVMVVHSS
ncbi:hypothetical protein [Nocardia gamkensis]|uniref:hypothetical protein n=1 Tax=Nocardia gamkensis TaxID=352869 RepID=UPI0037BE0872